MTAPTFTLRQSPPAGMLDDGYQAFIAFAADPDISLWEKTVKPPGLDGGDSIPVTTMHNTTLRTFAARALKTLTEGQMTVAYDPAVLTQINALINVETTVCVYFSDGSGWAFFGYLKNFEPNDMAEGEQPEATCTIVPTNRDPSSDAEEVPVYSATAGSGNP